MNIKRLNEQLDSLTEGVYTAPHKKDWQHHVANAAHMYDDIRGVPRSKVWGILYQSFQNVPNKHWKKFKDDVQKHLDSHAMYNQQRIN